MSLFLTLLQTLSTILTAGIAITSFSLLIYALTFNLRDRVARTFMLILLWITIAFTGEALGTVARDLQSAEAWYLFQWVGLVFLPTSYYHFSDAILSTTGRPSRGRRRLAVRLGYFVSAAFLIALPAGLLVGGAVADSSGFIYLERTDLTGIFTLYYCLGFGMSWANFYRAYQRSVTSTSRRRMRYLMTGALAPALGSFPYLLFGASLAANNRLFFWLTANATTILVFWFLISMAYAVAFFGTPWPDRVVRRRLAQWLVRGPVTASITLGVTTLARRLGVSFGVPDTVFVPLSMVLSILVIEHLITVFAPIWETWFYDRDQEDLNLLQNLEDRFMTYGDAQQFLESVLAAVCDQCQSTYAFAAEVREEDLVDIVSVGLEPALFENQNPDEMVRLAAQQNGGGELLTWGDFAVIPLHPAGPLRYSSGSSVLLGVLGFHRSAAQKLDEEQSLALRSLSRRAALVLEDRRMQEQIFASVRGISPQMEQIQRLRAASRYNRAAMLNEPENLPENSDISQAVKDALSHYWGGPKLTTNPLVQFQVVQRAMDSHEGNLSNAMRSILREAVQRVRPEGDRRFTGEWILYNILEMKFLEGRRVREVARKLAMSEADLYRKQRLAIEAVAKAILEMEKESQEKDGAHEHSETLP